MFGDEGCDLGVEVRELLARRDARVDDVDAVRLRLDGGGMLDERADGTALKAPVSVEAVLDIGYPPRPRPAKKCPAFYTKETLRFRCLYKIRRGGGSSHWLGMRAARSLKKFGALFFY